MLHIQNNPSSLFRVCWPQTETEIIALGTAFIAYESTLSLTEQLKDINLALIQAAHTLAKAAVADAWDGEAARAIAAETLRQKYEVVKPLLEIAFQQLKAKYYANLAQLERWDLETVVGSSGIRVRKPRSQQEWLAFLNAYVTQETSLPPAEQLAVPALAQMQTLNTEIQATLTTRANSCTAREVGVQEKSAAVQELLDLLQLACAVLVAVKFQGQVTNELQYWGFRVFARMALNPNGEEGSPEGEPVTGG